MVLEKGDGLILNPALFHAAAQNDSANIQRSATLLQISSAFGKLMEMIETFLLIDFTWDGLKEMYKEQGLSDKVKAFVCNVAEGYPFPTNLDKRVLETAGIAPASEQDLLIRGLEGSWANELLLSELRKMREDARP